MIRLCTTAIALVAFLGTPAIAQSRPPVLGTWTGRSVCTIANSPCTTETVVYDITPDTSARHDPARDVQ